MINIIAFFIIIALRSRRCNTNQRRTKSEIYRGQLSRFNIHNMIAG